MPDVEPAEPAEAVLPPGPDPVPREEAPRATVPGETTRLAATIGIGLAGVVLAIAYLPQLFNHFAQPDDEGFFLVTMREFLKHGSLYDHTRSGYGPFYYSLVGAAYKLTGSQPTPFNGRLIVLIFTALAACGFAATVFRVSRSLLLAILCQVGSFLVLVRVAGNEPMHPAFLIMVLLSIEAYALVSYAINERPLLLYVAGGAAGAIAMCKINVGVFAAAAIVMGVMIGNRKFAKSLRGIVAIGLIALPFVLMFQRLYDTITIQFAVLVALALLATLATLHVDEVSLPAELIWKPAVAAVGVVIVSSIWPLLDGTSPSIWIRGVLREPLKQVDHLTVEPSLHFSFFPIVLTLIGCYLAYAYGRQRLAAAEPLEAELAAVPSWLGSTLLPQLVVIVVSLWIFGLGLGSRGNTEIAFASFLPPVALLCALTFLTNAPPRVRMALRFLVPLAILQALHAYPVGGSQQEWATVALFAPCTIALGAALDRLRMWREAGTAARALAVGSLCLAFALAFGMWPVGGWREYRRNTPLNLAGTSWVRLPKKDAVTLRQLTSVVKQHCDTFYSAPGIDSLYIFTGIDPPTGLLSNHAGVLTTAEQRDVGASLAALQRDGKRVCIVRDLLQFKMWQNSSYGHGPLGVALAPYQRIVARVGLRYTVSLKGAGEAAGAGGGAGAAPGKTPGTTPAGGAG